MTETQGDRINKILEHFHLNQAELAGVLKITQEGVSKMISRGTISKKVLNKLEETYKISRRWLLTGEGEMLKQQEAKSESKPDNYMEIAERMADRVRDDYKQRIEELQDHIKTLKLSNAEYRGLLQKNKILN